MVASNLKRYMARHSYNIYHEDPSFFKTAEDFLINGLIPENGFKIFTKIILRGLPASMKAVLFQCRQATCLAL